MERVRLLMMKRGHACPGAWVWPVWKITPLALYSIDFNPVAPSAWATAAMPARPSWAWAGKGRSASNVTRATSVARMAGLLGRVGGAATDATRALPPWQTRYSARSAPPGGVERSAPVSTPPKAATSAREEVRKVAPKLIEMTEKVVYGDVWERPGLSKRDRSLITVAALIAMYRGDQLTGHLERALANGVTKEEIGEVITHMALYAGWPTAMSAGRIARKVFEEAK